MLNIASVLFVVVCSIIVEKADREDIAAQNALKRGSELNIYVTCENIDKNLDITWE